MVPEDFLEHDARESLLLHHAVLQLAVSAAVKEHLRCRNDRRHAARQRPVQVPGLAPTLARNILNGLKSLTMPWKLFSA